jgi:hypothetical protein
MPLSLKRCSSSTSSSRMTSKRSSRDGYRDEVNLRRARKLERAGCSVGGITPRKPKAQGRDWPENGQQVAAGSKPREREKR